MGRMYASHLKQIVANLRLNGDLLSRLCAGVLTSDELVSMTPEEMATREKKRKRQTELEDSELGQFSQWKQQIKGLRFVLVYAEIICVHLAITRDGSEDR